MWDKVSEDEGFDRLEELCETSAWKEMISMGASTAMISSIDTNAKAKAEKIVSVLINNARPVELAIQDEMVNQGMTVAQTSAGQIIDANLREVRAEAEREMEELRDTLRKENEASAAKAQEAIRAQELAVAKLQKQAEQQAREQQVQAERLRQEREDADRRMDELREKMHKEGEINAAKLEESIRAREREVEELRRRGEEQAREQRAQADQLQIEREKADRRMIELQESMLRERESNAARAQEAALAHQHAMNELNRQAVALKRRKRSRWWFKPISFIADLLFG